MIHTLKRKGKSWNKCRPPIHPQADTRDKEMLQLMSSFHKGRFWSTGHGTPVYRHSILADPNIGRAQKNKIRINVNGSQFTHFLMKSW